MPKKPGLSRDDHSTLGEELAAIRDRLGAIAVQLSQAYPNTVANLAVRAQGEVDRLRSELDSLVFQEYPKLSTKGNVSVYYPERNRE